MWSFGVLIYELFCNKTPFSGCVTERDLKARIAEQIQYNQLQNSIPHEAKELILSCLRVD